MRPLSGMSQGLSNSTLTAPFSLETEDEEEEIRSCFRWGKEGGIRTDASLIRRSLSDGKRSLSGGEKWMLISGRGLPVRALVIFEFLRCEYCSRQEADAGETTGN